MSSSHFRAFQCLQLVLAVAVAVFVATGCIPSTPEQKQEASSTPSQAAPTPSQGKATAPDVKAENLPPDANGKPKAALKITRAAEPNASVTVENIKDGPGFTVNGTFNLTGKILPDGPGKWKFTGQFSMAEPDFAVGKPVAAPMSTFGPNEKGGMGMNTNNSMIFISLPVRPPSAKAPEGTAMRVIPFELEIEAPENAQFTVSLTQM